MYVLHVRFEKLKIQNNVMHVRFENKEQKQIGLIEICCWDGTEISVLIASVRFGYTYNVYLV